MKSENITDVVHENLIVPLLDKMYEHTKHSKCLGYYDEHNGDYDCEYGSNLTCEECKYGIGLKDPEAKCNHN